MDQVIHLFSTPFQQTKLSVSESVFQFIESQEFLRHGNGYIRISTGDTSKDFRDDSKVIQCEQCNSSGELKIEEPTIEFLEAMVASSRLQ